MARVELQNSGVVFDKAAHTYELNGKMLSGITDMLHRQLFPNEFNGIPWSKIVAAGDYGTTVHDSLELFDTTWQHDGSVEVQDYIELCKQNNLVHEASEYNITDGNYWSSNIDKVFRTSDEIFDLGDLKSYGKMTPQKLAKARWQLSIYAYLFELQNPKAKVGHLFVLHIRNKQKKDGTFDHIKNIVFVNRIPSSICKELLTADEEGRQFLNPYDIPAQLLQQETHIRELLIQKAAIEEELAAIKAQFMDMMTKLDTQNWIMNDGMKITRKLPTTRTSFDLPKLKKAYPDIPYDDFLKVSNVSGSLSIAV